MSYCLNPLCPHPENPSRSDVCLSCGQKLLLCDRYRIMQPLGLEQFSAKFLAIDESLPGRGFCVIKQLRPSTTTPAASQMARQLFQHEAMTLGKVGNHPQVPRLLDYFVANQQFYLCHEYAAGLTLQEEVKQNGSYSEAEVKHFLREILPVLEYIHSQQVIHRDIKPAHVIRRAQDGKLMLTGFGLVKNQPNQNQANNFSPIALTADAVGTPGFAPPEQMALRPVYASDIYALGVTCIYLLCAKSPEDLAHNPSTGEMLWQSNVQVSQDFAEVLRKMLQISVCDRYQNVSDIIAALN